MVFDKMQCIRDITSSSNLNIKKVERIVEYFINRGNTNILEFPLFEIEDKLVTIPSLFLVNDWQFTIVNGHYAKNIPIKNREKTLSIVTEGRIEKTLQDVSNITTVKTKPYSYKDANVELQCSDIDFAIYDKIRNIILVIEAKWIDNLPCPSSYTETAHPHPPTDKSDYRSPTHLPDYLFAMLILSGTSGTANTMLPDAFC